MIFAIILSYCSLHATKVFILADGTVQLVRPKCSFWGDIFTPARPLDSDHKFDNKVVDDLLQEILDDPPEMPAEKDSSEDTSIVDAEKEVEYCHETLPRADRSLPMLNV